MERVGMKSSSFLVRNRYSFCFRLKVPPDLQTAFARKELRYSLRTLYLKDAESMAQLVADNVLMIFHALRKGDPRLKELTPELVNELVRTHHKEAMEFYQKPINPFTTDKDSYDYYLANQLKTIADLKVQIEALEHFKEQYQFQLATGKYEEVETKAQELLESAGVQYDKSSVLYCTLCKGLLKTEIATTEYDISRLKGDVENPPVTISKDSVTPAPAQTLVSEVIPKFISENEIKWTEKTKFEVAASLDLFIEFVGDVPIQSIKRAQVAEYKDVLKKLPPNKNKSPQYKGKSLQQIIAMKVGKTLSVERVNKHLQRAGALFGYAINHGIYEGPNPATDMQLPKDKWETLKRAPYTNDELEKLFRSEQYLKDSFTRSYMFWTPVIALFHGMRQNEIAGLFLDDIKQSEDGVWYFDLFSRKANPRDPYRVAPIHPYLLGELNFLAYVESLRGQGHDRLFSELSKGRDGYGRAISNWFNGRYKDSCGIVSPDGRMRDFHSFRASFITHLRHKKVHDRLLKEVVGHSVHIDVTDRYTDPYPMQQLLDEIVSRADFHKLLDLTHLKSSKYVVK
jgi:integrase